MVSRLGDVRGIRAERLGPYTQQGLVLHYLIVILIAKIVRGPEISEAADSDIYTGA